MLIVVNQDWFFLSHRLPVAFGARDAGADVRVMAGDTGKGEAIRAAGFEFLPLPIHRGLVRPWQEWRTLRFLRWIYQRIQPDLVHHVTLKPVIYGSFAARSLPNVAVVNAISGLGYVFTSTRAYARALRPVVRLMLRRALANPRAATILQNPEDLDDLVRMRVLNGGANARVIRGSGVDCERFAPTPEPTGPPVVLLAGRMLWGKGIQVFADAARLLRQSGVAARFVLVGEPDPGNPEAITTEQLAAWAREGAVEWWGQRSDMPAVMAQASIVVLPTTYGEGVPKVLLEAAAAGRPIVATDLRGCREIVRDGVNGALVAPGDALALSQAVGTLLASADLRGRYGAEGRRLALREFREDRVVGETLDVYRDLLAQRHVARQ